MPCYTKALGYVYPVCEVIAVSRLNTNLQVSYRHETTDVLMFVRLVDGFYPIRQKTRFIITLKVVIKILFFRARCVFKCS